MTTTTIKQGTGGLYRPKQAAVVGHSHDVNTYRHLILNGHEARRGEAREGTACVETVNDDPRHAY